MNPCETCRYSGHQQKRCMAPEGLPRYMGRDGCPLYAMSAQAYLSRVMNAQRRIAGMQERAVRYREMATRATSSAQAIRVSGTGARSRVEEGVCALVDICRDIDEQAQKLRDTLRETCEVIARLTDAGEREVLELRYLSGLRWEDIARRMMYDERQVRRIHVRALEHVQREMDCMELATCRGGWGHGPVGAQAVPPLQ